MKQSCHDVAALMDVIELCQYGFQYVFLIYVAIIFLESLKTENNDLRMVPNLQSTASIFTYFHVCADNFRNADRCIFCNTLACSCDPKSVFLI